MYHSISSNRLQFEMIQVYWVNNEGAGGEMLHRFKMTVRTVANEPIRLD